MKRKLFIILALAALTAALCYGTALADYAFTKQPASGTIPVQGQYSPSWTTNFTQKKAEIVRVYKENTGSYLSPNYVNRVEVYDTLQGTGNSYTFQWETQPAYTEYWYVNSYYGSGAYDYITSTNFTLTNASASFLLQNSSVTVPVQGQAPVRWETNCTVEKVEIIRVYKNFTSLFSSDYTLESEVIGTVEDGKPYYYFHWQVLGYAATDHWVLKGYLKDRNNMNHVFFSDNFQVNFSSAKFTVQPSDGTVPVQGDYTITWNTNYVIDQVKIIRVYRQYALLSTNYTLESEEYDALGKNSKSYTFHWKVPDFATEYWYVKTEYSDSSGASFWGTSNHFTLTNAPAEITMQPVGGEIPIEETRRVSWATNFTISKVDIIRAYRYYPNLFSSAYEIATEVYDTVEGNATYYDFPWGANSYDTEYWYLYIHYPDAGSFLNMVTSNHFTLTDRTRAFTTQPASNTIPSSGSRSISWNVNFTATGFDLIHADTGETETSYVGSQRSASVSTPGIYYLRAKYTDGSLDSSIFILTGGSVSCAFTDQPKDGFADKGKTAKITWRLNFTPETTQILRGTGSDYDTYTVVDTLGSGVLYGACPTSDETYVLKAYARQSADLYCYSQPFRVTAYEDNGFILQPKSGSQLEGGSYRVTWQLSFQPVELYLLWCDERGRVTQGAPVVSIDPTRNWYDVVNRDSFYTYRYLLRAYFDDKKRVDSIPFEVATVPAEKFVWQPQEYSISHLIMLMNEPCEVEWSVNFKPATAMIQHRPKGSANEWVQYAPAIIDDSLISATIPFNTGVKDREFRVATTSMASGETFCSDTFNIAVKCEFTFDANGHGVNPETQYVDYLGYAGNPGAPGEAGEMHFRGWYTEPACNAQYNFGVIHATKNTTLYAGWAYAVTFDANGHQGVSDPAVQYVRPGRTATVPNYYTAPTLANCWYVAGWYLEPDCINEFDFTRPINGNLTLYARWAFDGYAYTFNWSGHVPESYGMNGKSYETGGAASFTYYVARGKAVSRPSAHGTPYPGYDIYGWYTEPEYVNQYDFTTLSSADVTLYARWMRNIHVTTHYIYPDRSWTGENTYTYGAKISNNSYFMSIFSDLNSSSYTNQGWHFTGWYTDEDCTQLCDLTAPLTEDLELYSGWEKIPYTVAFNMNGGTGMEDFELTLYYGDAIPRPAGQPTRSGYVFRGWVGDNGTYFYVWTNTTEIACTGNATYSAYWIPDGIAIDYRNFPDENFRNFVSEKYDKYQADGSSGADGYLSNAEAEAVTSIIYEKASPEELKISDLTGIRYFPNLQTLSMTYQNLSAADLSWNIRLTSLRLAGMPNLTYVGVKACTELTEVNFNNNTALTSLDLSANTALTSVECRGCASLTSLILHGNALKRLIIYDSGLQTVEITGCPILMETVLNGTYSGITNLMYAYYTHPNGNSAGTIQVTNAENNTVFITDGIPIDEAHFPDAGFRKLLSHKYYDKNQNGALTNDEIDQITSFPSVVSGVYNLRGVEYLPKLDYVVLNGVGLEEIDLSANPLVDILVVRGNSLTTVDVSMLDRLSHLDVANNPGLHTLIIGDGLMETLNCYGCPLILSLDLSTQPQLLKAYVDGESWEDEYEGVPYMHYSWQNEGETLLGFLRVDPGIDIALPEWEWNGTEAVFILPNGTRVNAKMESEISADGKSITYTATALLREVPFSGSRTFCLVTFSGADVPAQAVSEGSYAVWPGEPIVAGSIFDGWYTDAECTEEYAFGTAVTEGLTVYAGWTTPAPSGFIKLPAILSRIESEAFAGISAQAVIVPPTVTGIAYDAFSLSGVRYIYGFPDTAAQHFADTYGYTFVPIDDDWMAIH